LEVFTITNKTNLSVSLSYNGKIFADLDPGQTSDHFADIGMYQVLAIIDPLPPPSPSVLLEVDVTLPFNAQDKTYTTSRNLLNFNFLVEIDYEGSN
jgi:hypothetical protein